MVLVVSIEEPTPKGDPIVPLAEWGKDHWSTLAYIETRAVDFKGIPNNQHMRCDADLHPQFAHARRAGLSNTKYPTRTKSGEVEDHDDWSCLDDAEAVGYVENIGTGLHRVYSITPAGQQVCEALRRHLMDGGTNSSFSWPPA